MLCNASPKAGGRDRGRAGTESIPSRVRGRSVPAPSLLRPDCPSLLLGLRADTTHKDAKRYSSDDETLRPMFASIGN
jgi:hypothetical protein